MARKTEVGVTAVRAWAGTPLTQRGRVSREQIAAYEKANPGHRVVTGYRPAKTVTLPISKVDKRGRRSTRKIEKPISEVRAEAVKLGLASDRGVLSAKAIQAVAEALSDPVVEAPVEAPVESSE